MAVYDDEEQKLGTDSPADEELRKLTGIGKDEEGAMDREAHNGAAADIASREGIGTAKKSGATNESDDRYGPSMLDEVNDKLGRGYREDGKKSRLPRLFKNNSRLKKRATLAAALGAGSLIASVIIFFAMLPLKIESIISNLEKQAGAASSQAMEKESSRLARGYITKYIVPSLKAKRCANTVDATCVAKVAGDGPVAQLYKAWQNTRFEKKLADRGLSFGRSGNTYYINTGGKRIDFTSDRAMTNFLNDPNTTSGSRHEVEQALSKHLKTLTLWERVYYRFRLAPFVNKKVGTRHCINSCKKINEFKDKASIKKQAAKAYVLDRVLTPLSENYAFILQCMMVGGGECNVTNLQNAEEGDTNRSTPADRAIRDKLAAYAATLTDKQLADLVDKADRLGKNGLSKYLVEEITKKIVSTAGGKGAEAGATAAKAVDPITWILIAGQLADTARNIGPTLKYLNYAANAAAAAQLFTAYQTVASETKSGQIDSTQLGSFSNALDTSLDTSETGSVDAAKDLLKGSDVTPSGATQTPLYQARFGSGSSSSGTTSFLNNFGGKAYAASTTSSSRYVCDDNKSVPQGKLVCNEEQLNLGTGLTQIVGKLSYAYDVYLNSVPGMNQILGVVNVVNRLVGALTEEAFKPVIKLFNLQCKVNPACKGAKDLISAAAEPVLDLLKQAFIATPFNKLSGGRVFDMMAAGSDVVYNTSCQEVLGCANVSSKTAAAIQAEYLKEQQAEFNQRPFFARMFSTDTPYSFVSRLAVTLPSNVTSAGTNAALAIQQNPLGIFTNVFAGIFSSRTTSAATIMTDPFGVPQSAYVSSQIPNDPQTFWNKNCIHGPEGIWNQDNPVGEQLDISDWLNNSGSVTQDKETGQAIFLKPNRCLLILASVQSTGGLSDPTLLPEDSLSSDSGGETGSNGGASFRIATFNVLGASHDASSTAFIGRAAKTIDTITKNHLDIVGLQEFQVKQRNYIYPKIKDTYDIFPAAGTPNQNHSVENSIIWDKTKFDLVGEGQYQPNVEYFCFNKLNAPYVKLQSRATGQQFIVLNTHDPSNSSSNSCSDQAPRGRYENALEHAKIMKQFEAQGLPVLFTGDFNSKYALVKSGNGSPYQGKAENLTYCILTRDGGPANDAYDVYKKRAVTCPNKTPPGGAGGIDHVYLSTEIGVSNYISIPDSKNGSDHPTIIFDVTIPGSDSSTAGAKFSLATWNLPASLKAGYASAEQQWQLATKSIQNSSIGVVGFQEIGKGNFNYLKKNLSGYDSYPASFPSGEARLCSASESIFYNTSRFTFIKGDYVTYPRYPWPAATCGNGGETAKKGYANAPIVWLQDKTTQQEIIVMNIHAEANVKAAGNTNPAYNRYVSNKIYIQKIQELKQQNPNTPVFLTGDFNEGTNVRDSGNVTYQRNQANLIFCMFAQNGLMKSADGPAMKCDPKYSVGGVDYIYVPSGVTVDSTTHIKRKDNGSDHPYALVANVTVGAAKSSAATQSSTSISKVLVVVEENHSLAQMKNNMPYTFSLAQRYGYATNYAAIRHPSLPNYIAIAAGDTMGVTDDKLPSAHKLGGQTVFGQAIANGKTAKLYAESMASNCVANADSGSYRSKHNPWTYFVDERSLCRQFDVPFTQFNGDVAAGKLPNVGMLIPNMCHDAHNCSLATADTWFKNRMQTIFNGPDWKSGKLAVVLTADEDDNNSGNKVLTAVIHPSLNGKVVTSGFNHYSLSQLLSAVSGSAGLHNAQNASSLISGFGL